MAKNIFNSIQLTKPKTNSFDLSHDVKLSADMGNLVPICVLETVPGDKFNISCESLIRFAPLVAPVMHRMDVSIHYFFVPNRILWDNWEKFITNTNLNSGLSPAFPYVSTGEVLYTKLSDYLGLPLPIIGQSSNQVNAMPFAAYQKIYNDYYRDQNLIQEVPYKLQDGNNLASQDALQTLRKRAWEHDYFTSSLPFAQKGEAVSIPLGDVRLKDDWEISNAPKFVNADGIATVGAINMDGNTQISTNGTAPLALDPNGSLEVQPTLINDLRRAYKLQEWLEKAARGGSRYVENILIHFGVKSSDARLQRAEYITGSKSPVVISEVLNTTGTDDAAQGEMAGHGVAIVNGNNGSYYCEEHGYIIGIMSIMPKTAYQQGIPKHFLKTSDPFQYYWPSFANLGEQEVIYDEIYAGTPNGKDTFGYLPRYAEYKNLPSRVAGDFRTTLDFWHLGRVFNTAPALNQQFIECIPDKRIFAVEDPELDSLYIHVLNKINAIRPMPKYGTPSF